MRINITMPSADLHNPLPIRGHLKSTWTLYQNVIPAKHPSETSKAKSTKVSLSQRDGFVVEKSLFSIQKEISHSPAANSK